MVRLRVVGRFRRLFAQVVQFFAEIAKLSFQTLAMVHPPFFLFIDPATQITKISYHFGRSIVKQEAHNRRAIAYCEIITIYYTPTQSTRKLVQCNDDLPMRHEMLA